MNSKNRSRKKTIFWKVLAGHVFLALFVLALTGSVSFMLIRRYIINSNFSDLTDKAGIAAQMLSRPDGRLRFLTSNGLFELESICDAQLLYVDSNMVAQRMPVKTKHRKNDEAKKSDTAKKTDSADNASTDAQISTDAQTAPDTQSSTDDAQSSSDAASYPPYLSNAVSDGEIPPVSEVLHLLNRQDVLGPDFSEPPPEGEVSDASGEDTPLERVDLSGTLDEELVRSIMSGTVATDIRTIHVLDSLVLFAGMPIIDFETGNTVAAIVLCRSIDEVGLLTGRMILLITWSGIAALAGAALIAYFISRRFTRPIESMSLVAERMLEGRYGERCSVKTQDELGRLGSTLDILSQRLSDVIGNLNAEKTKLEMILSAIGEGIIAIDAGGSIIHHNAAALNMLGIKSWADDGCDPDTAAIKRDIIEMLKKSIDARENITLSWRNITQRVIQASASPVIDGENEVFGAVCLINDVTEAQKTEQMRRDFIANISHELRTPLTGIRGMVEPLMDGLMQTEKEKSDCYNVIYQETIRLEKLIRDMLDLSRMQSGRVGIELEPMPPVELLKAVQRRMADQASKAGVELSVEGDESLAVMGNEDRIIQVLIILADNALSFTPTGGKITLFARRTACAVEIGVSDTGCGIDPVDLPYIWERFYKADRSRMRTGGTGLGLAIAKIAVELMGGKIDVKTRLGEGSTFYFTLECA